jgi:methionyl-tRNA formyltransferase
MKRVMIFGKNNIAIECTKILLKKDGVQVVGCCPNNNDKGEDGWQKSFMRFCDEKKIAIFRFKDIRSNDSLNFFKKMDLDFIFSFQYDQIIGQEVIDVFGKGAVNLHFSPLPKYRGVSPIAWALINGEDSYGVTMHYIDPGIDTGDIIAQTNFKIDSVKNARELYSKCERTGVELFKNTIDKLLNDSNERAPQSNIKAIYYPNGSIDFNKCEIDFNKSTYMLNNWIRAFIFPPFQYPVFKHDGRLKKVVRAYPVYNKNKFERPGSLVTISDKKFMFSTNDSYIELEVE